MAWTPLASRLASLPRVLAGPILRKVTPNSATVWLALRKPGSVTLTVKDESNTKVMQGSRRAVSIGANLHIVAVTAKLLPVSSELTEGVVYQYDLTFDFDDNLSVNLATATANAQLGYAPLTLPSFALPPKDLNMLRLIQGSCRMPHAQGKDMLPFVDDLIQQSASNALARPHQMLLTGDQIYADDVSDALLLLLTDAGETLLGWTQMLPIDNFPDHLRANLPPYWREEPLTDAGFSSEDLRSHLLSLGEYLSMYLFVWSDVLWPTSSALPTFDEIMDKIQWGLPADTGSRSEYNLYVVPAREKAASRKKTIESDTKAIAEFSQTLPKVRRVLANIPSYMIFDDHEVTDDWNMTRAFCSDVYGSELGRLAIQNALVAYTLCQHWGNATEQFESSGSPAAGFALLQLLDTRNPVSVDAFKEKAADYARVSKDIRKLLAVHDAAAVGGRADSAVFHDTGSLRYDFSVEGPGHQVIFTDTRTWRSFPKNAEGTYLLTRNQQTDQFKEQILDAPDTRDRLLFVVLTTNAPPVQPIRAATRHDRLTNALQHYPDLYEAWELPSVSFDRLLVALTSKLPLDASQQHTGPVILLSGDVHHSFATRIIYRASKRYEDDAQPRPATAVIVQLVASSIKKQTDNTVAFQRSYYAAPHPWISQRMIRHTLTEGYLGWNFARGSKQNVGTTGRVDETKRTLFIDKQTIDVTPVERLADPSGHDSPYVYLTQAPHYRYRFDYLLPTTQFVQTPAPSIPPLPPGSSLEQRKNAARAFDTASRRYRYNNLNNPPKVVGVNNFGEIRLDWGAAASRKVNHILRWWDNNDSKLKLTTYSVRLDINSPTDVEFFDIKARVEP